MNRLEQLQHLINENDLRRRTIELEMEPLRHAHCRLVRERSDLQRELIIEKVNALEAGK